MDIKSKNYMETNTVIINQLTWFVMVAFKSYISTEMFTLKVPWLYFLAYGHQTQQTEIETTP